MNEFIVEKQRVLTPQQQVVGVLGINRDGQYDHLFKPQTQEATS